MGDATPLSLLPNPAVRLRSALFCCELTLMLDGMRRMRVRTSNQYVYLSCVWPILLSLNQTHVLHVAVMFVNTIFTSHLANYSFADCFEDATERLLPDDAFIDFNFAYEKDLEAFAASVYSQLIKIDS